MIETKYNVTIVLFLMYPGGNLTLRKPLKLSFVPFKKLWLELNLDKEDEDNIVIVKDINYNIISKNFEVFCDEITYTNKEDAEKNSLYYINTLNFYRTK
jgi:hypothetical protein